MSQYDTALSEAKQQELLEKYDPEAGTRKLKGAASWIAFAGLLAFSLFHVYTGIFGMLTAQLQRSVHLGFAIHSIHKTIFSYGIYPKIGV